MSNIVFVYGSLRKGCHNHFYLEKSEYIGTFRLNGFRLLKLCSSYPTAIRTNNVNDEITVEVYEISDETLNTLDRLEGHPNSNLFYRQEVNLMKPDKLNEYKGWIYYCTDEEVLSIRNKESKIIPSGDWLSTQ